MGVKDAAGLSGNYVNADSENEDDEVVKVNSCMIRGDIKYVRDMSVLTNDPPHHPPLELSTHLPSTHPTMNRLNRNELQECREYEVAYRAYLRGDEPPMVPVPRRWREYLEMSFLNVSTDPYPPPPMQQPVYQTMSENTVSMPSEALTTIIHAINRPSPAPGPRYLHNHMNPRRELTRNRTLYREPRELNHYHRGYGGNRNGGNRNGGNLNGGNGGNRRGGYQGRGGRTGGNRRGARSGRNPPNDRRHVSEPPLVNNLLTLQTPVAEIGAHQVSAANLDFLNKFANVDLVTNAEASPTVEDINMAIEAGSTEIGTPEEVSEDVSNTGPGVAPASGNDVTV